MTELLIGQEPTPLTPEQRVAAHHIASIARITYEAYRVMWAPDIPAWDAAPNTAVVAEMQRVASELDVPSIAGAGSPQDILFRTIVHAAH